MNSQLTPDRMDLPPPLGLHLMDGDRVVGWIRGRALGFGGFPDEATAARAAWLAHHAVSDRLARRAGAPPLPIDAKPLAIARRRGRDMIVLNDRGIGVLIRPSPDSRAGSDSFGFEIDVPPPTDELTMRSMGHLAYRALRGAGSHTETWRSRALRARTAPDAVRTEANTQPTFGGTTMDHPSSHRRLALHSRTPVSASQPPPQAVPSATRFVAGAIFIAIALMLGVILLVTAPLRVTVPLGSVFVLGLLGTAVISAIDRRREHKRARHEPGTVCLCGAPGGRDAVEATEPHAFDHQRGWSSLAGLSVALLLMALVVPRELAIALSAIGLAGLFVVRLSAMFGGWAPRGVRVKRQPHHVHREASGHPPIGVDGHHAPTRSAGGR